jgi:hypothetical protein
MRVHLVTTAVGLIAVAASVAACSAGSTSAGATSSGSSPAAASSHSSTSGSAASSGSTVAKNFDVCTALPAATASQITGTTFNKTTVSDVEGVVFGCDYDGPNSALLQVSVDTEGATYVFQGDISAMKSVGHGPTMVSGVGDEAFSTPDPAGNIGATGAAAFASYGAVFGQVYIKVGGLTYVNATQGKQIVEELHGKL